MRSPLRIIQKSSTPRGDRVIIDGVTIALVAQRASTNAIGLSPLNVSAIKSNLSYPPTYCSFVNVTITSVKNKLVLCPWNPLSPGVIN